MWVDIHRLFWSTRSFIQERTHEASIASVVPGVVLYLLVEIVAGLVRASLAQLPMHILLSLVEVVATTWIMGVAWRVVGGQATIWAMATAVPYVMTFLLVVVYATALAVVHSVQVLAPELMELAREMATLDVDRVRAFAWSDAVPGLVAIAAGMLVISAAVSRAWGALRALNGVGRWRAHLAFIIYAIGDVCFRVVIL